MRHNKLKRLAIYTALLILFCIRKPTFRIEQEIYISQYYAMQRIALNALTSHEQYRLKRAPKVAKTKVFHQTACIFPYIYNSQHSY